MMFDCASYLMICRVISPPKEISQDPHVMTTEEKLRDACGSSTSDKYPSSDSGFHHNPKL